jgi:hypothetical protein
MGTIFISCALTGLSIPVNEGRGVLLLASKDRRLVGEPLWGEFQDYGGLAITEETATARAMWRVIRPWERDQAPDLQVLSRALTVYPPWRPHFEGIPFSLYFVIDDLFRAAVAETMPPARRRKLGALPVEALFEQAFGESLLASALFEETSHQEREAMRDGLLEVIAFTPWMAELGDRSVSPVSCSRGYYEDMLEPLRERYAAHPHIIAALNQAKDGWFHGN